jgi:hypothetical protein
MRCSGFLHHRNGTSYAGSPVIDIPLDATSLPEVAEDPHSTSDVHHSGHLGIGDVMPCRPLYLRGVARISQAYAPPFKVLIP